MLLVVLDTGLGEAVKGYLSAGHGAGAPVVVGLEAAVDQIRAHLSSSDPALLRLVYVVPTRDVEAVVRSAGAHWASFLDTEYARSRLRVLWVVVPEDEDGSTKVWGVVPESSAGISRQAISLILGSAGLVRSRSGPGHLSPDDRIALVSNVIRLYQAVPEVTEHDPGWTWLWQGVFSVASVRVGMDRDYLLRRLSCRYLDELRNAVLGGAPASVGLHSGYPEWVRSSLDSQRVPMVVVAQDRVTATGVLEPRGADRRALLARSASPTLKDWATRLRGIVPTIRLESSEMLVESLRSKPGLRAMHGAAQDADAGVRRARDEQGGEKALGFDARVAEVQAMLDRELDAIVEMASHSEKELGSLVKTLWRLALPTGVLFVAGGALWILAGWTLAGLSLVSVAGMGAVAASILSWILRRRRTRAILDIATSLGALNNRLTAALDSVRRWAFLDAHAEQTRKAVDFVAQAISDIETAVHEEGPTEPSLRTDFEIRIPEPLLPADVLEALEKNATESRSSILDLLKAGGGPVAIVTTGVAMPPAVGRRLRESVEQHLEELSHPVRSPLRERLRALTPSEWHHAPIGMVADSTAPRPNVCKFVLHPTRAQHLVQDTLAATHPIMTESTNDDIIAGVAVWLPQVPYEPAAGAGSQPTTKTVTFRGERSQVDVTAPPDPAQGSPSDAPP